MIIEYTQVRPGQPRTHFELCYVGSKKRMRFTINGESFFADRRTLRSIIVECQNALSRCEKEENKQ